MMMEKLPEPARTVCTVAAFTGLTRSELRGLRWEDYDEKAGTIKVQRKVVGSIHDAPKTEARENALDVTLMLKKIFAAYKEEFPPVGAGWVFRGRKNGPLSLDNLSRRDIPQFINGAWFGWHAFRRGLGTRLNELRSTTRQSVYSAPRRRIHDAGVLHPAEPRSWEARVAEADRSSEA